MCESRCTRFTSTFHLCGWWIKVTHLLANLFHLFTLDAIFNQGVGLVVILMNEQNCRQMEVRYHLRIDCKTKTSMMFHGSHLLASMGWTPKYGLEGQCGKTFPFCEFLVDILLQQQPYITQSDVPLCQKATATWIIKAFLWESLKSLAPPEGEKRGGQTIQNMTYLTQVAGSELRLQQLNFTKSCLVVAQKRKTVFANGKSLSAVPTFCYKHKTYSQTLAELNWLFHGLIFQLLLPLALQPEWLGRPGI